MRTDSRELLAVGILGGKSRVIERIETLLRGGRKFSAQTSRRSIAAGMLVLGGLLFTGSLAPRWIVFAQQPPLSFEVISVKLNTSKVPMVRISGGSGSPRFTATNASLRDLIKFAYHLKNFEISGESAALDTARYDIEAKAAEPNPTDEQIRRMVQGMLAGRFHVTVHRETKEMPVYFLVAGKGGIRLAASKEGACVPFDPNMPLTSGPGQPPRDFCGNFWIGPNSLRATATSMKEFLDGLSTILGRPVIDKIGYIGTFDVAITFSQEGVDMTPFSHAPFLVGAPANEDSMPSIFTVLQEQLGLKLESGKGSGEMLVIEHAEKPDAN